MSGRSAVLLLLVLALRTFAAPGFVTISSAPAPSVPVGDTITITLRLFDYTDQAEIDRFRFDVLWPVELFEFVQGSIDVGTGEGPNQQWLSKPNQESVFEGFVLSSLSESTEPGRLQVYLRDTGTGQIEQGTLADTGFLVAFKLRARAVGTGLIRATPYAGATGQETFYGTAGTVLGVPQFSSVSRTVTPDTRLSVSLLPSKVVVSWATNAGPYHLQRRFSFNPASPWNNVNIFPSNSNGFYYVTVPITTPTLFFRLSQ